MSISFKSKHVVREASHYKQTSINKKKSVALTISSNQILWTKIKNTSLFSYSSAIALTIAFSFSLLKWLSSWTQVPYFPKSQPLIPFPEYSQYFLSLFSLYPITSQKFSSSFSLNSPPNWRNLEKMNRQQSFSQIFFSWENPIHLYPLQLSLKFFQSIQKKKKMIIVDCVIERRGKRCQGLIRSTTIVLNSKILLLQFRLPFTLIFFP